MPEAAAVAVRDLVQRLGWTDVLRGVSFELPAGLVLAVLGPNGAGKTTLLRVLATLLLPTRGEVRLFGQETRRAGPALRGLLGVVGHHTFLYPQLSGWENLWFWARVYGVPDPARRVAEALETAGLQLYAHDPVRQYSRGMQQRLALGRVLLHDPKLLLLDEPHTGLDRQASALLDDVVARWRERGRTVVVTSHDLGRALAASDRVLVLRRGKVILSAKARAVTLPDLEAACGPDGGAVPA